jgi:hypothetical protein
MCRNILIAALAGIILLAFAALPPILPATTMMSHYGSAQAERAKSNARPVWHQAATSKYSMHRTSSSSDRRTWVIKRPPTQQ